MAGPAQEMPEAERTVVAGTAERNSGGLLQEIIAGATDGSKPVSELLRSMQVLGKRGGAAISTQPHPQVPAYRL